MADPCPIPVREAPCELQSCTTDPPTPPDHPCPAGCELGPCSPEQRAELALKVRITAAEESFHPRSHPCNCDEITFENSKEWAGRFPASYTKGLPHDPVTGEVIGFHYCELLRALASGEPKLFEELDTGCCTDCLPSDPPTPQQLAECRIRRRAQENPQAAFAFQLQGADSHALCMPPAPAFSSAEEIAEIAENYWMALARDVPFTRYDADPLINDAANDLAQYKCQFAPTTPWALFRGHAPGSQVGPYVSQFLYMDAPFGATFIPARIRTLQPGIDYMTGFNEWLAVQNGCDRDQAACDDTPRFIRNGRDLAQYVHVDLTFNAFVQAGMILTQGREPLRRCEARPGMGVEFARCLPYINPSAPPEEQFMSGKSATQIGFATFGQPHLFQLLLEAMGLALRAVWYQKWSVHRRLRPEEFAGRIDRQLFAGVVTYPFEPNNFAQLQADILPRILQHSASQNQNRRRPPETPSYLLPQAYAEGSPLHPSYGSGHSTVAGALGTILKAFFPAEQYILNPVVPTDDGTALTAFNPGGDPFLTVEGEINKLVDNIGLGRNIAGVHWRSDHQESILLGEEVAIRLLCEQRNTYNEEYEIRFRKFDGTEIRIRPGTAECPEVISGEPDPALPCARTRTPFVCAQ